MITVDEDLITLGDDDDSFSHDVAGGSGLAAGDVDLVVGPTGTAIPVTQARFQGLPRLPMGSGGRPPRPPGMGRQGGPGSRKPPKKPGAMPPFALFIQEHRMKLMEANPNISFSEVGKRLGEMWHALDEAGKEDYRQRSREIGDQKLKEWREKMKDYPFDAVNAAFQPAAPKRRRTHGYAIFSSEMRKQVSDNVALSDTTKMIAEQWRNAPPAIRQIYEAKAAAINEAEARKQQQLLMQNQRRQHQLLLQQQQMQQQILFRQHQQQRQQIRAHLYPSPQGLPGASPARRVLPPPTVAGGMKLPSSITVSRVQTDLDGVLGPPQQQRLRGPPPLVRAGSISAQRSQMQRQLAASTSSPASKNVALQQQHLQQRNGMVLKRPRASTSLSNGIPLKQQRLSGRPTTSAHAGLTTGNRPGRPSAAASKVAMCRLCAKASPLTLKLRDRPEMIEAVEVVLGMELDLDSDRQDFLPDRICRSCFTVLTTLVQFRKSCSDGQDRLRELVGNIKPKVKTIIVKAEDDHNDVDIDLDCEVDEGESIPLPVSHQSTTGQEAETLEGDSDEKIDPLMFLQIGEAEGNYAAHDDDDDVDDQVETFEDQVAGNEFFAPDVEVHEEEDEDHEVIDESNGSNDNNNSNGGVSTSGYKETTSLVGEKSKKTKIDLPGATDIEH